LRSLVLGRQDENQQNMKTADPNNISNKGFEKYRFKETKKEREKGKKSLVKHRELFKYSLRKF
jgi:hypothetical protein